MALMLKEVYVTLINVAVMLLTYCWHKHFRVLILHHLLWLVLMMIQDIFVVLFIFFLLLEPFFAQKIFVSFDFWSVVCVMPYQVH